MKKSSLLIVADAPPTGTEGVPPNTGCQRIQTDQVEAWRDMPQPFDETHWVRGQTSLAFGKFEGYIYFEVTGGLQQHLILSQTSGTFSNNENLELATSAFGPWTDAGVNTATPPGQVDVDCDIGCFGAECDPAQDPPIFLPDDPTDIPKNPNDDMHEVGANQGDEWPSRWNYLTTRAGGTGFPFESGSVTGAFTGAVAEIVQWIDPGAGMGNVVIQVDGSILGSGARRFVHGELLDHGRTTGQVTLANPMEELLIAAI